MPITVILLTLLTMLPHHARAADDRGQIIPFGGRRGPLLSTEGRTASQTLHQALAGIGLPELPPVVLRHIRQLEDQPDRAAAAHELARYAAALRFYLKPPGDGIPGLEPESAHEHALQMVWRREKLSDLEHEIAMFPIHYEDSRHRFKQPAEARDDAFRTMIFVVNEDGSPGRDPKPDPWHKLLTAALEQIQDTFTSLGLGSAPAYAKAHAEVLVGEHDFVKDVARAGDGYAASMAFAVRSINEFGLGLDARRAHERILSLPPHRITTDFADKIAEAYQGIYRRLILPIEDRGFGLTPEAARIRAIRLADEHLSAQIALDGLDRHILLPAFVAKPIREGGLGVPADQVESTVAHWEGRFERWVMIKDVIEQYRTVLARYLGRAILDGTYDEDRARDWVIEQIGDCGYTTRSSLIERLDKEGYPRLTLEDLATPNVHEADGRPARSAKLDLWGRMWSTAANRIDRAFADLGLGPAPTYARAHAAIIVNEHQNIAEVEQASNAYAAALAFGVRPLSNLGPGFDVHHAHERAAALPEHWNNTKSVALIAEAYGDAYRRLIAPVDQRGFGMPPEAARDEALRIIDKEPYWVSEVLDRRQVLPPFVAAPIRDGGLGVPSGDVESTVEQWQARFYGFHEIKDIIALYRSMLARYLGKAILDGTYDEVRARDWVVEQIGNFINSGELIERMDDEGYPRVTLAGLEALEHPKTLEQPGPSEIVATFDVPAIIEPPAQPIKASLKKRIVDCVGHLLGRR